MSTYLYYSGPAKAYFKSPGGSIPGTVAGPTMVGLSAADAGGTVSVTVDEATNTRGAAQYGDMFDQTADVTGKITLTPFSDWGLIPHLLPAYAGVSTNGGPGSITGALTVGAYAHDPGAVGGTTQYPAGAFTFDGREYNFVRTAVTKHPTITLGAGQKLFGSVEITAIGAAALLPGASGFLMSPTAATTTGAPITEYGSAVDPSSGYAFPYSAFSETHWTGTWGSGPLLVAGMEAEDGWTITPAITYETIKIQGITRAYILKSARFMVSGRLVGPTHSAILARVLAHTVGSPLPGNTTGTQDLTLTSAGGKTCVLYNCEIRGAGFEFGGTKLNTGSIGFVQTVTPGSTASTPWGATTLIAFSA